jgi:hypothetical protein
MAQGLTAETIAYNLSNHKLRLETWTQAPASIWRYEKISTAIGPDFDTLKSVRFAKDFTYPGRVIRRAVV